MHRFAVIVAGVVLFLAGCSSAPPKKEVAKKEEPKQEPEPITGKNAFYKVYVTARSWAPDIQCLRVVSIHLQDVKSEPGKAAAWQVIVVSPSKLRMRTYTWSAVDAPGNIREGVFPGAEEAYTQRGGAKPFLIAALKTDTDAAYKVAAEKSAEYMKRNPNLPISFLLESVDKFNNPAWRVIWGESAGTSGNSVFVDATTGSYLETRH